jgi:hypothetical protein
MNITVQPGSGDYTATLKNVFAAAPAGATVNFPAGSYSVAAGTTYVLAKPIILTGPQATLVNVRLIAEANISISGLSFVEKDCTYTSANPSACPVSSPILTLGAQGYPITQASISGVALDFTRAYTGIAVGSGSAQNISISNFSISDNQLSGITLLSGSNITITNGSITGGNSSNVDDGIAIDGSGGSLSNITISNIKTNNTFDAVGIGAHIYYPMQNISVTNTQCLQTAVCIYVKAGSTTPPPSQFAGYSELEGLSVSGVTVQDPTGSRYLSSLWVFAEGGARVTGTSVSGLTSVTRSQIANSPQIWMFTDAISAIQNTQLDNFRMTDTFLGVPNSPITPGYPAAEGLFLQDQGNQDIANLDLAQVDFNGLAYFAIDSGQADVLDLTISNCVFLNVDVALPTLPSTLISYAYTLNGATI